MKFQPLQKNGRRFGQRQEMDNRTPKTVSSKAPSLRVAENSYPTLPAESALVQSSIDCVASTWHRPCRDERFLGEKYPTDQLAWTDTPAGARPQHTLPRAPTPPTTPTFTDYTEEIALIIISLHERDDVVGHELAEAFREAAEYPPITEESLRELNIHNIRTNIKLRHDVNFDRDLSFRPNTDGAKGQAKRRATDRYWLALVAELKTYAYLFQRTPPLTGQGRAYWASLTEHAKRRIPVMFQTIHEILKTLVPEQDHSRVDEHLDVSRLMQEIERGVFNQVRLAEWLAQLLKEHCAPMRDTMVDEMVACISEGVAEVSPEKIVRGLHKLFTILETMKLDVANHQIRTLKPLLIEDTANFEKQFHLDRIIKRRSRVDVDAAHAWFLRAQSQVKRQSPTKPRDLAQEQLHSFAHAVVRQIFKQNGCHEFPETFYLDQDRIWALKAEIEDLVHIEICMDAFMALVKSLGYNGTVSQPKREAFQMAIEAIMSGAMGYGPHQWARNSEALSMEILRHSALISNRPLERSHDTYSDVNEHLLRMFQSPSTTYSSRLEAMLLQLVLRCTDRHISSTPTDLFNNLVPLSSCTQRPSALLYNYIDTSSSHTPISGTTQWKNIASRIAHMILLHWRIWDRIAYVQEDKLDQPPTPRSHDLATPPNQSVHSAWPPQQQPTEPDAQVVTALKTGETQDAGHENHVAHQAS